MAYPFAALIALRRSEREARELALKVKAREAAAAAASVEASERHLVDLGQESGGRPPADSVAQDWHRYGAMVTHSLARAAAAAAEAARVAAELAARRAEFAAAKAREDALLKHRAHWLEARRQARLKRDEREADDRAATRAVRAIEDGR